MRTPDGPNWPAPHRSSEPGLRLGGADQHPSHLLNPIPAARRRMISIKLPPDLIAKARVAANAERRTLTGLIEIALVEYLERHRTAAPGRHDP